MTVVMGALNWVTKGFCGFSLSHTTTNLRHNLMWQQCTYLGLRSEDCTGTMPQLVHGCFLRRIASRPTQARDARCNNSDHVSASTATDEDTSSANAFTSESWAVVGTVQEGKATVDALGESTYGSMRVLKKLSPDEKGVVPLLGLNSLNDIVDKPVGEVRDVVQAAVEEMGVPQTGRTREIFCNRTLNLRAIRAIGYDMDYTLIDYDVNQWEGRAYEYGLKALTQMGVPVDGLSFDPEIAMRGLVIDARTGNLLKVDRFGLVKRAMHGNQMLSPAGVQRAYGRELVHLADSRWIFLNTLFSVSEGCLYMQMVTKYDLGEIPAELRVASYDQLWDLVKTAMFRTHVESRLKDDIMGDPGRYIRLDPDLPNVLLDMKESGKTLLLITNSDWKYTSRMMEFAYNRFLPEGMTWRDLFDIVIVQARKPAFWGDGTLMTEIVSDDGLMRACNGCRKGGVFYGGSARMVQDALGISGDHFLYVGDHIYTDAALAKLNFKWRTALIIRELEEEIVALEKGVPFRRKLKALLKKKEIIGDLFNQLRLGHTRDALGRDANVQSFESDPDSIKNALAQLLMVMDRLDQEITPMVLQDGETFSPRWGYLSIAVVQRFRVALSPPLDIPADFSRRRELRSAAVSPVMAAHHPTGGSASAGVNDKSQLQRQIEKYADIYMSRVNAFGRYSPYCYFRSAGSNLVHFRDTRSLESRIYDGDEDADVLLS